MNNTNYIETNTVCYHCGDTCSEGVWEKDDKAFCCNGCQTVYGILKEHQLDTYYQLESQPGIKKAENPHAEKFAFLDDAQIREKLIRYSDEECTIVVFRIPAIHCSSCIWLLENLYKLAPGVLSSTVNFMRKEANIRFDENEISLRELVELLYAIGYTPEISTKEAGKENSPIQKDRSLFYKIGIAGFCFGNIMLLSFPEYLGLDDIGGTDFRSLFAYLNFALALPVFFYCATDYYRSAWTGLKQRKLNLDLPIALGIIALFSRSSYEIFSATGSGYMDSLAGLLFFMLIGKWFQSRTYEQLSFERDYKSYFPLAAGRIAGDKIESIAIEKIEIGDHLKIFHDELIPADAYLLSDSADIDYSFVSGESEPVKINAGENIFAGGRLKSAAVRVEVKNKVSQSYLTSLWNEQNISQYEEKKSMTSLADQLSGYFTPIVLLIAFATALFWGINDWGKAALAFTSVLIVACPCALALSSPFTLGNAMRMLGRNRFYLKNTSVVERLSQITHIVFDKTGTLSLNRAANILFIGNDLSKAEQEKIAALTSNSSHPVSRLIEKYLKEGKTKEHLQTSDFKEIAGSGIETVVNGVKIKLGNADFLGLKEKETQYGGTYVSFDGELRGCFILTYEYREGLGKLIQNLKDRFKLSLISGDHDTDKSYLQEKFGSDTTLYFRQSPHDKLNYISSLQEQNAKTLMIGDGLNDAGALMQSNVGIAVADDINNFSPACDAILEGSQLKQLNVFLNYAKDSLSLVKIAFTISLLYNSIGIAFAVSGMLSPLVAAILMPLSSVSIVAFGTSSTWLLAKYHKIDKVIPVHKHFKTSRL